MAVINVRTNWHWKTFLSWHDLPKKAREEFDYLSPDDGGTFMFRRGEYYDLGNFVRAEPGFLSGDWHAHQGTSYWTFDVFAINPEESGLYRIGYCWQTEEPDPSASKTYPQE